MEQTRNITKLSLLSNDKLRRDIEAWLKLDRNPQTMAETQKLLNSASEETLVALFSQRLAFGTAGLRGLMGAGFSRLNDVTIRQTSQGYCAFLLDRYGIDACAERGIVIGYDARYNSESFANISAAVFLSRGFKVHLFSAPVHTPLVPFTLRRLKGVAGIVVTASHNPKEYNGYKVYADNGVQIISPMDGLIVESIDRNLTYWDGVESLLDPITGRCLKTDKLLDPLATETAEYLKCVSEDLCSCKNLTATTDFKVVYTAMHGVGYKFAKALLDIFGYSGKLIPVKSQCEPDPDFPTVAFPNPEEAGALNLAIAEADLNDCTMVVANDPDADRFTCAEKVCGTWRQFTGDEIGVLLASYAMDLRKAQGVPKENMLFVCSVVSSQMLRHIAQAEGCQFVSTLTGFKNMYNKAVELQQSMGSVPVCVYEEALGYALTPLVRDKDGVSAMAVWIEMACRLKRENKTVTDRLAELRKKYGYFVTNNHYLLATPEQVEKLCEWLRLGGKYRRQFGRFTVSQIRDVGMSFDSSTTDGKCELPPGGGEMITLTFEGNYVLTLRSSGTEPKFKWYSEAWGPKLEGLKESLGELVSTVLREMPLAEIGIEMPNV